MKAFCLFLLIWSFYYLPEAIPLSTYVLTKQNCTIPRLYCPQFCCVKNFTEPVIFQPQHCCNDCSKSVFKEAREDKLCVYGKEIISRGKLFAVLVGCGILLVLAITIGVVCGFLCPKKGKQALSNSE